MHYKSRLGVLYFIIFIVSKSFNAHSLNDVQVVKSAVTKCPCSFQIIVTSNLSKLNILVLPHSDSLRSISYELSPLDIRPGRLFGGHSYEGLFLHSSLNYHHISVTRRGRFSLSVRFAPIYSTTTSRELADVVQIRALERQQNETCPIVIPEQARIEQFVAEEEDGDETVGRKSSMPSLKITGGSESTISLAKYMVMFATPLSVTNDSIVLCTGTLVSATMVVTAAHCVYDNETVTLSSRALVDTTRLRPFNGTELSILSIEFHPLFNTMNANQSFYDIALVTLSSNVPDSAKFMKVNVNQSVPVPSSFVRMAGFGHLQDLNGDPNQNGLLHHVDMPVIEANMCDSLYDASSFNVALNGSMQMCAGYIGKKGCGICHGDSGGPVFQYDDSGEPVLVGVITGSDGCGSATFPAIAERTWSHFAFLSSASPLFTNRTEAVFATDGNWPSVTTDGGDDGENNEEKDKNKDEKNSTPFALIVGSTFGTVVGLALLFIVPAIACYCFRNR